jgi:hypothetical protein
MLLVYPALLLLAGMWLRAPRRPLGVWALLWLTGSTGAIAVGLSGGAMMASAGFICAVAGLASVALGLGFAWQAAGDQELAATSSPDSV